MEEGEETRILRYCGAGWRVGGGVAVYRRESLIERLVQKMGKTSMNERKIIKKSKIYQTQTVKKTIGITGNLRRL